jgi:hypothetical protein
LEQLKQDSKTMEVKLTKEAAGELGADKITLEEKDFRSVVSWSKLHLTFYCLSFVLDFRITVKTVAGYVQVLTTAQ